VGVQTDAQDLPRKMPLGGARVVSAQQTGSEALDVEAVRSKGTPVYEAVSACTRTRHRQCRPDRSCGSCMQGSSRRRRHLLHRRQQLYSSWYLLAVGQRTAPIISRALTRNETMDHPGACRKFGACWRSRGRMVLRFSADSSPCGCCVESDSNTNTSAHPNARYPMVWRSCYLGPTGHSGSQNRVCQCQRFQSIRFDYEPECRRTKRLQWSGGLGTGGFFDSKRRVLFAAHSQYRTRHSSHAAPMVANR